MTAVTPLNLASAVMDTSLVTADFNEAVAPISGGSSFVVTCALPCTNPTGVVTLDGASMTATYTPAISFDPLTLYTATITAAQSLANGRTMTSPKVWTFTTAGAPDTTRPRVSATAPVTTTPGPTLGARTDTAITAVFTEDMLQSSVLAAGTFTVTCASPCTSPSGVVTYISGTRTAVFTHAADLSPATTYTATITTAAMDLAANALAGNQAALPAASDYVWTFTTLGPPTVTAVAPVDGATGVPVNITTVDAEFSEPVTPITGSSSFTLTCSGPCTNPTGTVTLDSAGRIASFTRTPPTPLLASTRYTATVTGAQSVASGIAMTTPYSWSFTTGAATDTTRPRVTITQPLTTIPGPTLGVPPNESVAAVFTEDMVPESITAASFTVTCAGPCTSPVGSVSYSVGSRTAVFEPVAALAAATTYTATITIAATDLAGNALGGNQAPLPAASSYVWTFTTGAAAPVGPVTVLSTRPANGAAAVCPDATINATFGVPSGLRMDPLSVNAVTFTVVGPGPAFAPVAAASVFLDPATGRIASFTPQSPLVAGDTYTATIVGGPTGVADLAVPANEMASDHIWTFTVVPTSSSCIAPPSLGSAAPFGTFGGSAGMTNTGILTVINGDIGTIATGTSSVTGFHDTGGDVYTQTPANIGQVNGLIYTCTNSTTGPTSGGPNAASCSIATQGRLDANAAYLALVAMGPGANPGGNLATLTLTPGVYTAPAGSFLIQGGDLTLDAQGDANATWVFLMSTTLTVGGPGVAAPQSIILSGGAQAKNVFWQVGSAATINAAGGGTMVGTIISQAGAAFSTVGNTTILTLNGRALSLGASVTVVDTVINVPAP